MTTLVPVHYEGIEESLMIRFTSVLRECKAPEHPKTQARIGRGTGGNVLECGAVAPLSTARKTNAVVGLRRRLC
jgi:hypothetical protein